MIIKLLTKDLPQALKLTVRFLTPIFSTYSVSLGLIGHTEARQLRLNLAETAQHIPLRIPRSDILHPRWAKSRINK
jgi:hypothetical protein